MRAIERKASILNDMFISKIIGFAYEVIEADKFTITILVGGKYRFVLWIANEWNDFETHDIGENFMKLDFSSMQKIDLFDRFRKERDEKISRTLLDEKKRYLKEIEELESKLGK